MFRVSLLILEYSGNYSTREQSYSRYLLFSRCSYIEQFVDSSVKLVFVIWAWKIEDIVKKRVWSFDYKHLSEFLTGKFPSELSWKCFP